MNRQFIKKMMWESHYRLKEGTSAILLSRDFEDLEVISGRKEKAEAVGRRIDELKVRGKVQLLPIRLCFITTEDVAKVSATGRGARERVGQIKAKFTRAEVSPLKMVPPFKVCTSIWRVEGHRCLYWGTIGISLADRQQVADNGDLVFFYTSDWRDVDIYVFKGLAQPNLEADFADVVSFLDDYVK